MKTLAISDSVFLGSNYELTKEGIYYLKCLQHYDYQIILLSNKSQEMIQNYQMKEQKNRMIYQYQPRKEALKGMKFYLQSKKEKKEIPFLYDYLICDNGSRILNAKGETLYQAPAIPIDKVEEVKKFLASWGYHFGDFSSLNDKIMDSNFYTFLPQEGKIFSFFASSRFLNEEMWKTFKEQFPDFSLSFFGQYVGIFGRDMNKKVAFELLCFQEQIEKRKVFFLLNNSTDEVFLEYYDTSCYLLNSNLSRTTSPLIRTLEKIDQIQLL